MADATPWADFHLHSHCSDGADAPEEVAARAAAAGARAFSLTDHDTTAGNAAAADAAARLGLLFVPGVEISAYFERMEVHIIALGARADDPALVEALRWLRETRIRRMEAIVARLKELGHDIAAAMASMEDAARSATGRMHIAAALVATGAVKRPQDAFDRFLNPGKPAYVPRDKLPAARAIELIHGAGGLAFVAHPGLNKGLRKALAQLLALPFDGIEAYHISHTPGHTEEFSQLARARGLLVAGGSDCHGGIKGGRELGRVRLPWRHVEALQERLGRA
jgi:predicted metal-dependent phosphoesterase TrpH